MSSTNSNTKKAGLMPQMWEVEQEGTTNVVKCLFSICARTGERRSSDL